MQPATSGPPPRCSREAVYLPQQDAFVTFGEGLWMWRPGENSWRNLRVPFQSPPAQVGQNRAMVYDPKREVILLVLGARGDNGVTQVYSLRPGELFR